MLFHPEISGIITLLITRFGPILWGKNSINPMVSSIVASMDIIVSKAYLRDCKHGDDVKPTMGTHNLCFRGYNL